MRERHMCSGCYAEIDFGEDRYCSECYAPCCVKCGGIAPGAHKKGRPMILCPACFDARQGVLPIGKSTQRTQRNTEEGI